MEPHFEGMLVQIRYKNLPVNTQILVWHWPFGDRSDDEYRIEYTNKEITGGGDDPDDPWLPPPDRWIHPPWQDLSIEEFYKLGTRIIWGASMQRFTLCSQLERALGIRGLLSPDDWSVHYYTYNHDRAGWEFVLPTDLIEYLPNLDVDEEGNEA